jgi:hypothetical protein
MLPLFKTAAGMRQGHATVLLVCMALAISACQNTPRQNPAVPTPLLPAVTDTVIDGLPTPLNVGQSVQLTALVALPDGTKKASDAAWASSDTNIATVSSTGLLTVVRQGGATITATAYQHKASVHLRVPFAITGVVHETFPAQDTPVSGARVEVQGGPDAGASATTDASGRFNLEVEAAGFILVVTKNGYESTSSAIAALPRDERPDVGLVPSGTRSTTHFSGGLCADWDFWYPGTPHAYTCVASPLRGQHFINVSRPGVVDIDLNWAYQEDYSAEFMWLEVQCGAFIAKQEYALGGGWSTPEDKPSTVPDRRRGPWRVPVSTPGVCEIKAGPYSSFKGMIARTSYQLDVTSPK